MACLEDLTTGTRVTGLTASGAATVESGEQGLKVIYRDADGGLGERFVYRDDEPSLELVEMGRPWLEIIPHAIPKNLLTPMASMTVCAIWGRRASKVQPCSKGTNTLAASRTQKKEGRSE